MQINDLFKRDQSLTPYSLSIKIG
ncbi:uncharacterized protein METZ01_LOCUS463763 [marine metagenome]|uniref:Uncharacterized protein n=1 Tax=marine metagenome TaxID=408172 RepID=A0A383ATP0_9ZZZZ